MKQTEYLLSKSYFFMFLMMFSFFGSPHVKAIEVDMNKHKMQKIQTKDIKISSIYIDKGFFKRFVEKVKTKISKFYRKIINKFKRKVSKRKSKQSRMKSGFKDRCRNLYNILLFSVIFVVSAAVIIFGSLYLYLTLGLTAGLYLLYILGIGLFISALVISLIYFSKRYILKPRY